MEFWIGAVSIAIGLAILRGWVSYRRFDYIGNYHLRPCQGRHWKIAFPHATNDEIRDFLHCLIEGLDFDSTDLLKFRPDDVIIDIYRSFYGGNTPTADEMECERFVANLSDIFDVPEDAIVRAWSSESTTLGSLFREIRAQQPHNPEINARPDSGIL